MFIFDKLFALLEQLNLSLKEFARMADISESTLRRMRQVSLNVDSEPYCPSGTVLSHICNALHCKLSDISEFIPLTVVEA